MNDNAAVEAERIRQQGEFDAGMEEGYYSAIAPLPEWFGKPYKLMTARQRGYIYGRETRIQEARL